MRTQVAIIGGGPAGLLLGQHLTRAGIDNVILERRSKEYVLARIRAGVLERGLTDQLRDLGLASRLDAEGHVHSGTIISYADTELRIDFEALTGTSVTVYGQTEVTRDLYAAREKSGARTVFEAQDAAIIGADTGAPRVTYRTGHQTVELHCDFIAGCDGFHGVSRQTIPQSARREFQRVYPFGWLGVLSETLPVHDELIYATSPAGFALCSMRNDALSRYYIQCPTSDNPANWSDDAFWDELKRRIPARFGETIATGPSVEKSIAPLRSFVCEPMRWGRLFLCGDAAHIVPPTGAKGLNTAASDVFYLAHAFKEHFIAQSDHGLEGYSEKALARVWKAERFSWWMTHLLHHFPDQGPFDRRMQEAEVAFLKSNESAQKVLAENYVGLPY